MDSNTLLGLLTLAVIGLLSNIAWHLRVLVGQQRLLLRHLGAWQDPASDEVQALARDPKRRLAAIRLYRKQSGAELKEAVTVIDQLTGRR